MSVDRGLLAKIHIAKKELGFDDETYRDILQTRYKKDSAAKLSRFEAEDLITHFKGQGWKVKRITNDELRITKESPSTRNSQFVIRNSKTSPTYEKPMARKVVAIWINLALAGVVRYSSDAALQSYVKRMTGVDNLAWCNGRQLFSLIEALKKWAKRKGVELE